MSDETVRQPEAPPTEAPATTIRRLMRAQPRAALGSIDRDLGEPYVSLAMVAVGHDATPLLYLSDLADHSKNLKTDPRASLLFDGTLSAEVPLAGARASVQGEIEPVDDEHLLDRYVARHPDAEMYRGFGDFKLYRLNVSRAHLVAGFGRIHWVDAAAVLFDARDATALREAEAGMIAHMNEDHADAVRLYAEVLLKEKPGSWSLTGVDPEGADLRLGARTARLWFDKPAIDAESGRVELVRLVKRARGIAAG